MHDSRKVLEYWDRPDVESMYDKHLVLLETTLIQGHIPEGSKVLDAGCGEGEGTDVYSQVPGVTVQGVDFSDTRLTKASARLAKRANVTFKKVDFLGPHELDRDYDVIVSQRLLINFSTWAEQAMVLSDLASRLSPGGRLILLEGSQQGVLELNRFRALLGLDPIPVKWHNVFIDDDALVHHLAEQGLSLTTRDGMGAFFMLTRGVRPALENDLDWRSPFNRAAATSEIADLLGLGPRLSRLKLWVFRNEQPPPHSRT